MVVLLVSGAIVLGGCGGGGSGKRLSKAEFAAKVSALCTDYQKKINAFENPQSDEEAVKLMKKYKGLFAQIVAETKKLKPPADEQASVDRILTVGQQQLDIIDRMVAALEKNDQEEFQKLVKSGDAMDRESNRIFRQLGATACAK
jgi:hypothetical protein